MPQLTHEEFLERLASKKIKYVPLDEYKKTSEKIRFQCPECGNVWLARPSRILSGGGCPVCNSVRHPYLSQEDAEKRIHDLNPNWQIVGKYTGYHNKLRVKCLKHDFEWEVTCASIFNGNSSCRGCALERKLIRKERRLQEQQEKPQKPEKPKGAGIYLDNYQELANRIIEIAAEEYKSLLGASKVHSTKTIEANINELEKFFKSQYFESLTQIDGTALIRMIRRRVDG